jgi:RimJ/RimL family protein N-acetyltransferase
VALRPLTMEDRFGVRRWMSDERVIRFTVLVPGPEYAPANPYSAVAADRYLRTLIHDPARRSFAITLDGVHVGNVGLKDLDELHGRSECFIEIGDENARGRGVGVQAMRELMRYAYGDLGLHALRLGVFEFNTPAIRLYERLGFERAGNYGWHWADQRFWEVLAMEHRAAPAVV